MCVCVGACVRACMRVYVNADWLGNLFAGDCEMCYRAGSFSSWSTPWLIIIMRLRMSDRPQCIKSLLSKLFIVWPNTKTMLKLSHSLIMIVVLFLGRGAWTSEKWGSYQSGRHWYRLMSFTWSYFECKGSWFSPPHMSALRGVCYVCLMWFLALGATGLGRESLPCLKALRL